ncbi:hypothetical protein MKL09_23535 [Methylobacterium sp. J-048]|uniref:hypothetical protein n=1 Tax=Methylobacterium sp. J-048 TaxID=2836635 RepID=UPI001FB8983E|nr:hypothetical protein [Methylobacterium sp. J-048]MCJ2059500.1 hypothetical protein [Methylobacterium sp. J-048]
MPSARPLNLLAGQPRGTMLIRGDTMRSAGIVAENVVQALERLDADERLPDASRDAAVAGLTRELLAVLPTPSGDILVAACNRYLAALAECGLSVPRVEAVNPVQGAVTMRTA